MMRITDVRLRRVNQGEGKMKAVASVTFDHQFVVHELRIVEGQNGLFVAMPSRRMNEGEYRDIAHPITPELRQHITEEVLARYHQAIEAQTA